MRGSVVKRKGARGTSYYVVLRGHWYRVPGAAQTARAAEIYRAQLLTALTSGELVLDQPRVSVAELAERWQSARRDEWRPHTRKAYGQALRLMIVPAIGDRLIATLSLEDLQRMRASLLERYSPVTVRHAMGVLGGMLRTAVEWRLLRSSPAVGLRGGKVERQAVQALSATQVTRLMAAVDAHPHMRAAVLLSLTGGLRLGEVSAARWQHLDTDARTYTVSGTEVEGQGEGAYVGPAKTRGSAAAVLLSPACMEALATHRALQAHELLAEGIRDGGWMFLSGGGRRLCRGTLQRYWHQVTDAAGLPRMGWHTLRHTCASLLIDQGAHPKMVQAQLRHTSIRMTLDVYGHLFPARQEQAVAALDAAFGLARISPSI